MRAAYNFCKAIPEHGQANIWVGSRANADDQQFLRQNNITQIVNVSGFDFVSQSTATVTKFMLNADELFDDEYETALARIKKVTAYMNEKKGQNTLVFCKEGINVSPLVASCYAGWYLGVSSCDLWKHLENASKAIEHNIINNHSFKVIIHPKKTMTTNCKCWDVPIVLWDDAAIPNRDIQS